MIYISIYHLSTGWIVRLVFITYCCVCFHPHPYGHPVSVAGSRTDVMDAMMNTLVVQNALCLQASHIRLPHGNGGDEHVL